MWERENYDVSWSPRAMIKNSWAERRKTIKPQAISFAGQELVKLSFLQSDAKLPLVIEPLLEDLQLPFWVNNNRSFIEGSLLQYGGLLFRGFQISSQSDFESFLNSLGLPPMSYMEAATPRTQLSDTVYTSTEFPAEQTIALHNELSYVRTFPQKIWFFCVQPAERGGETPIANVGKVYQRISTEIKARFLERGWMLVRNFGGGFGPTWQKSYHSSDRRSAEEYFRRNGVEFKWLGGDRLRTKQVRPATICHPKTGERVWFNHISFWHFSSLEPQLRKMLLEEFGEEGLPYNVYYGDGSPVEESVVEELREAYRQETIAFPWRKGDILMLDNVSIAHGRASFVGDRKVLAAMGDPYSRMDI
jgi:alpha-ketoglutarate-dependent taurine dioxygenase